MTTKKAVSKKKKLDFKTYHQLEKESPETLKSIFKKIREAKDESLMAYNLKVSRTTKL